MSGIPAVAAVIALSLAVIDARGPGTPSARLVSASLIQLPGDVDSSNPFVWDVVDGRRELFVITSWGGTPVQSSGASVEQLHRGAPVAFTSHPGHGVWMESIVTDDAGTWYGYYLSRAVRDAAEPFQG